MTIYRALARPPALDFDQDGYPRRETMDVYADDRPKPTGLVDHTGTPIYRLREPMGFYLKDST